MEDQIWVNLPASLHSTIADFAEVANGLAQPSTDDEIEQQAKILDRIAEEASEGASILRALLVRRQRMHRPSLPKRMTRSADNPRLIPHVPGGGDAS